MKKMITLLSFTIVMSVYSFSGQNLHYETNDSGEACDEVFIGFIKNEIEKGNPLVNNLRTDWINLIQVADMEQGSYGLTRKVTYVVNSGNRGANEFIMIKAKTSGDYFCDGEKFMGIEKVQVVKF